VNARSTSGVVTRSQSGLTPEAEMALPMATFEKRTAANRANAAAGGGSFRSSGLAMERSIYIAGGGGIGIIFTVWVRFVP
jgi:hypothetical protein